MASTHCFDASTTPRSSTSIPSTPPAPAPFSSTPVIGVLAGEGIGPEVVGASLMVLDAVQAVIPCPVRIEHGGCIGLDSERECGRPLSEQVGAFCADIFERRGAILAGPGGGRFVYDLRLRFDLFCKFSPLVVHEEIVHAGRMKPEHTRGVDLLVVRENCSGVYQGVWSDGTAANGQRRATHQFGYDEHEVRRILEVACRVARRRKGELVVVHKPSGVPAISQLWTEISLAVAAEHGIQIRFLEVDYAGFAMIQHPELFDVLVTPNLFGDIISDLGGLLLGSRGICYSGNFNASGAAVYQTNHGAARDLAGRDVANPAGQIFSLAMLLRESFGYHEAADLMERAVRETWRRGWRTADLAETGSRIVGTREMAQQIAETARDIGQSPISP